MSSNNVNPEIKVQEMSEADRKYQELLERYRPLFCNDDAEERAIERLFREPITFYQGCRVSSNFVRE